MSANTYIKILLLGETHSGKTTFASYLSGAEISNFSYEPTSYLPPTFMISYLYQQQHIQVEIQDVPGSEYFAIERLELYHKTDVILLFYSVISFKSLCELDFYWKKEIEKAEHKNTPKVVCGTKLDLRTKYPKHFVEEFEVRQFFGKKTDLHQISVLDEYQKTGNNQGNIEEVLKSCVRAALAKRLKEDRCARNHCTLL